MLPLAYQELRQMLNVTRTDIAAFTAAQLGSWLTELGKSAQRGCLAQQH